MACGVDAALNKRLEASSVVTSLVRALRTVATRTLKGLSVSRAIWAMVVLVHCLEVLSKVVRILSTGRGDCRIAAYHTR